MSLFCTDILCEPDKRFRYFILFESKMKLVGDFTKR